MAKDRTLRRKLPKKRYYRGGNQIEFQSILDSYLVNLQAKRHLYEEIHAEAINIYDNETSKKNDAVRSLANKTIAFLENFYQTVQTKYTTKQDEIKQCISSYGIYYTHRFIIINVNLENIVNEINEQIDIARNINDMFQQKKIHIHLIDKYLNMMNIINVNEINAKFNKMLDKVDIIIADVKKDFPLKQKKDQDDTEALERKKRDIDQALGMVNRPIPEGFRPSTTSFIQGCPLGCVLEGDQCVYYNDLSGSKTLVESVPFQKDLVNSPTSEYIIWFNKINQVSVGNPIIFKRKEVQYLVPLTKEDAELFNAKYVVAEQDGTPKLDTTFIKDIMCCWDQISTTLSQLSDKINSYYIDYDNIPQPVVVIDKVAPAIRDNESFTKYVCLLDEVDQILSGIQYIETDASANILYSTANKPIDIHVVDLSYNVSVFTNPQNMSPAMVGGAEENAKKIIPFYPNLYNYKLNGDIFTKPSFNEVDEFKYILLPFVLPIQPHLRPSSVTFDTLSLDPYSYNTIPKFYINKYLQISIPSYYCPFILQEVLMNNGDYFIIHNTGEIPIVFILSADEKRIVVYPNEVYCFVYTDLSIKLKYGYLSFDKNTVYSTKSKKVTKLTDNTYVFVETKELYDNGKAIMQTMEPLLDSENNLILAPSFNASTSIYYDIDDIYESNPIKVEIVEPKQVTLNNKTYDSSIKQTHVSKEYLPYKSDFVCITSIGNAFIFCDSVGIPLIDVLGYFISVPTPIFYDGTKTFWFSQAIKKYVTILGIYTKAGTFDVQVANQLTTSTVSKYLDTTVYTNKDSIPILGNVNTLVQVAGNDGIIVTPQLTLSSNITCKIFDAVAKQGEINKFTILNKINIYLQSTELLISYFKDISGNMNNLDNLRSQILRHYNTLSLVDAKTTYNEVLGTVAKLNIALEEKKQMEKDQTHAKEERNKRASELAEINTMIKDSKKSLEYISAVIKPMNDMELNSHYTELDKTYSNIEMVYASLNNNINDITDASILKKREENISILLNSIHILQQSIISLQDTIKTKQLNINALVLDEKKSQLQALKNTIDGEKVRLDTYISQVAKEKPTEDLKNRFDTSAKVIQSIIDTVDQDTKNNVIITVDTINTQLKDYAAYIHNINTEEAKIQEILIAMQNLVVNESQTELVKAKNTLDTKIMDFEKNHSAIMEIPVDKSKYTTELQDNLLAVQAIKGNVEIISDLDTAQADMKRIDELIQIEKEIQTTLQTNEMMPPPLESIITPPIIDEIPKVISMPNKTIEPIEPVTQISSDIDESGPKIPERLLKKYSGGRKSRKKKLILRK